VKVLFVHQNFPGQFPHLAPELQRRGHDCMALTDSQNKRTTTINTVRYRHEAIAIDPAATRLGRNYTLMSDRGVTVARAACQLRDTKGYVPDVIIGHSGWGETLFLKEVWPSAKLIVYAEFYYRGQGADVGFDAEFNPPNFDQVMIAQGRAAYLGQALLHADAGLSPTQWQASSYPAPLRSLIKVIHDGIDTAVMQPNAEAAFLLPNGNTLRAGDEVLTFVNRNLEPYRGYHVFMRALPQLMAARPDAQVVIVGGDEVSYGAAPKGAKGWKDLIFDEVRDKLDLARVHFLGRVPYDRFTALMQVSRAHAYLTYPFVLSWSMLEAMSAGALIVGSRTAPVEEVIKHGTNGLLVDFFDVAGWEKALTAALGNPSAYADMRIAARQTILDRFDLRAISLPRLVEFVEAFTPED
jgi:glycosyltransferase involved in cell wall biosynthesis